MKDVLSTQLSRRQLLKTAGLGAAALMLPLPLRRVWAKDETPSQFKYAVCNEMYGDWPLEKAFAFSAECGYKGLEIAPFTIGENVVEISAKRRHEVRKLAEKAGLEILGLHWLFAKTKGLHLTSPDKDIRKKTSDYLVELTRFCSDLGGRIMVLGSPKQRDLAPGMSKAEGMKYAAEVIRAAVPDLEKNDVSIALEPLAKIETNFLNTLAEALELSKLVDSPRCRLHFDCKAMSAESETIPELLHKYRDEAIHFHANDPNRQGPGFGKLDFVPIFKALNEIEYNGWVSVEPLDYSPGVEKLASDSIRYMRRCEPKAT